MLISYKSRCPNGTRKNKKTGNCEPKTKNKTLKMKEKNVQMTPRELRSKSLKMAKRIKTIIRELKKSNKFTKNQQKLAREYAVEILKSGPFGWNKMNGNREIIEDQYLRLLPKLINGTTNKSNYAEYRIVELEQLWWHLQTKLSDLEEYEFYRNMNNAIVQYFDRD